ncbi:similar to Saccharomyces cerevisiae YLR290C Putative protein of unknown function [Maudiozyma saulgeensis]|uniref:NAD-dependent epimerase/dehydratase domain-containing protein n=1 Tax=Maudiozyma saulgeensis TaxID=1789683 RepID=A0A1X7R6J4_9SACH|nr:similar to Saccharomyces cerevisiae YLR290C Putative protein of unknown function [Kazachstania saulgeensis]
MTIQKLVVFGGNGFLGKRICQQAVLKGMQVTGLSRSGKPPVPLTNNDKHWIKEVSWNSADIFDPDTYVAYLKDRPNVVDTIGILLENENYKKDLKNGLTLSSLFKRAPNPLLHPRNSEDQEKHNSNFTYERINTKSAMILADTFKTILEKNNGDLISKPSLTYVSADKGFLVIPKEYINSKRRAELYLLDMAKDVTNPFRPIIIRPGFMFDELNTMQFNDVRTLLHDGLEVLNCANKLILRNQFQIMNDIIRPTISTQQVGRSLVDKITNQKYSGILTLEHMLDR